MKFGYTRSSTLNQDLSRQIDQLKDEGYQKIYEEKILGIKKAHPQLNRLIDNLKESNKVIVTELTKLSVVLKKDSLLQKRMKNYLVGLE